MTDEKPDAVEVLDPVDAPVPAAPGEALSLPPGVRPSPNYVRAIELGKVMAESGNFPEYRDAAKAAVTIMIGMDLGITPTAAMMNIHAIEDRAGKISFVIESKVMGALLNGHPRYGFKVVKRDAEVCTLQFTIDGKPIEDGEDGQITYTLKDAEAAGLAGPSAKSKAWRTNPRDMLHWRAMAEGVRVYFPDLLAGQPVYAAEADLGVDVEEANLMDRLEPPKAQPLSDAKAEELKGKMRDAFDELTALNSTRVPPGLFANMLAKAEHSHQLLEARVAHLTDMRDVEQEYIAAEAKLEGLVDDHVFKATHDRAERKSSGRERLAVVTAAIEDAEAPATAEPKGDDDA